MLSASGPADAHISCAQIFFYLTWNDSTAVAKIDNATRRARESGGEPGCAQAEEGALPSPMPACPVLAAESCDYPCSSYYRFMNCCEDIFLPGFTFTNAFGFPQDRPVSVAVLLLGTLAEAGAGRATAPIATHSQLPGRERSCQPLRAHCGRVASADPDAGL